MGQLTKLPVIPGGMKTDIAESDLGNRRYQLIENVRISKEGEWETIKGYVYEKTGLSNIRAAMEFSNDETGERFILFQDGTNLKRLTYDDTVVWESDFSAGVDGVSQNIGDANLSVSGNQDGVAGEDDCLGVSAVGANKNFQLAKTAFTVGVTYNMTFDYLSGVGAGIAFLGIGVGGSRDDDSGVAVTEDAAWHTDNKLRFTASNVANFLAGFTTITGNTVDQLTTGNSIYFKNIVITAEYADVLPSTLSLPSGVTIAADDVLRFFYYNGVVRITGASDPMWYGYIDRTLFPDAWEEIERSTFEAGVDAYHISGAGSIAKYDCDADGDATGMWGAPEIQHALKVIQAANTEYSWKDLTVVADLVCRVICFVFRKAGGTGNYEMNIGSSQGGSQYASDTGNTEDEWIMLDSGEFTPTGTTVYVNLVPSAGAANDTAYFDFVLFEQQAKIVIDDWPLEKAELTVQNAELYSTDIDMYFYDWGPYIGGLADFYYLLGKVGMVYDDGQFSLLDPIAEDAIDLTPGGETSGLDTGIYRINRSYSAIKFKIKGTDLLNSWLNDRINRVIPCAYLSNEVGAIGQSLDEDQMTWYVVEDLKFDEAIPDYVFSPTKWRYEAAFPNRITTGTTGAAADQEFGNGFFMYGVRVNIKTEFGEVDTVITQMSGAALDGQHIEIGHGLFDEGLLSGILGDVNQALTDVVVTISRKWLYDASDGYIMQTAVDVSNLVNDYDDYADIPSGTSENIVDDYTHHIVVKGRAYVISPTLVDTVRYSSEFQYDNFPLNNEVTNLTGSSDDNMALVARDDKLVIMKGKTISQVQLSGTNFYLDIGIGIRGLAYTYGYLVIDDILYFMDKDDIYAFKGLTPVPILGTKRLKEYYEENVATGAFILYDKKKHEVWFVLDSDHILIYQEDFDEVYIRDTDVTLVNGYLDENDDLIIFDATQFLKVNHAETEWDEDLGFRIEGAWYNMKYSSQYKKFSHFIMMAAANANFKIDLFDPARVEQSVAKQTHEFTIATTEISQEVARDPYLFKNLQFDLYHSTVANDRILRIRESELWIEVFDNAG